MTQKKDRACIIIANRISAIKDADEIIVLDDGVIIERGTHSELLNSNGFYSKTFKRQSFEDKKKVDLCKSQI